MNDFKRLKSSVKISDVMVGEGYNLEKTGSTQFVTSCLNPEHKDDNPSLQVSDKIGYAKCFSCGFGGDIFNLLSYIRPELKGKRLIEYIENSYIKDIDEIGNLPEEVNSFLLGPLIEENFQDDKDFKEIMNFIALYWSQNVPRDVMNIYSLTQIKSLIIDLNEY